MFSDASRHATTPVEFGYAFPKSWLFVVIEYHMSVIFQRRNIKKIGFFAAATVWRFCRYQCRRRHSRAAASATGSRRFIFVIFRRRIFPFSLFRHWRLDSAYAPISQLPAHALQLFLTAVFHERCSRLRHCPPRHQMLPPGFCRFLLSCHWPMPSLRVTLPPPPVLATGGWDAFSHTPEGGFAAAKIVSHLFTPLPGAMPGHWVGAACRLCRHAFAARLRSDTPPPPPARLFAACLLTA